MPSSLNPQVQVVLMYCSEIIKINKHLPLYRKGSRSQDYNKMWLYTNEHSYVCTSTFDILKI